MEPSESRRNFVRAALLVGVGLVLAQSAAHLIAALGFGSYHSVVDLDRSNGIPDIVSTLIIGGTAVAAFILSSRDPTLRVAAAGLGIALLIIAIDDALHTDDVESSYGIVVIATIVAAALLTIRVALRAPVTGRILLLTGVALLALDVKMPFAYDQLMNAVGQPWVHRGDLLYELGIVLDEGLELTAWILMAVGLWDTALAVEAPSPETRPDFAL